MFNTFEITYTNNNGELCYMLVIAETMVGALQTFRDNTEFNPDECREIKEWSGKILIESFN